MDNNKEIKVYEKKTNIMMEQAEGLEIKTSSDMIFAVNLKTEIRLNANKIKAIKERYTKPANEILKTARAMFSPMEKKFIEAERVINGKMIKFDEIQQIIVAKKIEKITQKVAAGKLDIAKAGEKMEKLEVKNSYQGESGSVQFRIISDVVIIDLAKVPRSYLLPNSALIRKDVMSGIKIPGVEVRKRKITAGRI